MYTYFSHFKYSNFSLYNAGVGVQVSNQLINSLLFADDITLIANSEQELHTLLDIPSKFAGKWNLKFNATRSKVMVVGRRIDREKVWKLGDNCIHETNEYKYLGVYVTRTLKSNYHVQTYIKDNMDNKINFMSRILAEHGNFNRVELGNGLWNSVLLPSISNRCGAWLTSSKVNEDLQSSIQFPAAKIIMKTKVNMSKAALPIEHGWEPINDFLNRQRA